MHRRESLLLLKMPDWAGYLVPNSYDPKPSHFAEVHMGASDDGRIGYARALKPEQCSRQYVILFTEIS